ncbi:hypothetical protein WME89_06490 [Sorangium sp. So ce321]|uniref:hypothetical protein n=1 Tax=Sorangium sp. So ce321 TaxID=3133300 RepID=UPI003F5D5EC4
METAALQIALYSGVLVCYDAARCLRFLVDLIKGDAAMGLGAVGMTFVILSRVSTYRSAPSSRSRRSSWARW